MSSSPVLRQGMSRKAIVFMMLAALILSVFPQASAYADGGHVYYVGGVGASDANPGIESEPFATIQHAATIAEAGDTVKIRDGIYRETVIPTNSGSNGKPIIFEPDGDAAVTVSGTDAADGGWSVYEGNIYKKAISLPDFGYNEHITSNDMLLANQVFVNSKMMIEARWPNVSDSDDLMNRADYRDGKAATWTASGSSLKLSDSEIPAIEGGWAGGTLWTNGWFISQTRSISEDSGSQLTLPGNYIDADFRDYYYLTGKLGALDSAQEWFYDGTDLYLWMPNNESPSGVEVKMRNYAFDLSGKSNITVRGIDIFAATITTDASSSNITLDGMKAQYISHGVTLTDSDVIYSHTNETGIRLIGPGSVIKNSIVEYSSNQGIVLGTGNIAENNVVHDVAYDGTYASGISPVPNTSNQKILHNTIYDVGRSNIDMLPAKNVEIGYNDLYNYGLINTDTGAIYSARNADLDGTRIHHNWIHDTKADLEGNGLVAGIYYDQGAGPTQVDHNVLWNNEDVDIYVQHESAAEQVHHIYNNTFATGETASYLNYTMVPADVLINNIYRDQVVGSTPTSTSLTMNKTPKFLNEGERGLRFRLQESSQAIDAGADIVGVTDGYAGIKPDIGAYEFGGEDWIAGYIGPDWSPNYESPDASSPDSDTDAGGASNGTITINDAVEGEGQNQFHYVGNWGVSPETGAYLDNEHYSNETDAYYEVKFTGTQVKVYAQKNNSFGVAAMSIDGGPEKLVDGYNPTKIHNTLLYSSEKLSLGEHVLKVRVTGTKNVNSGNYYHVADRVVVTTGTIDINDADVGGGANQFEFIGTWGTSPETGAFMDNEHYSNTTDAYYQVRFVGTQAKLFAQKYKSLGIVAVSVDGGEEELVDCYSPTKIHNTLVYSSPELEYGGHILKVRITGTKNDASDNTYHSADRVQVVTGFVPFSSSIAINDMDTGTDKNQYEFVGTWGVSPEAGAYMDNEHYSNTTDSYYQVRFDGTQVRLYAQKYKSLGIIGVSIDGGEETLVDTYNPTKIHNTLVYTSSVLTNGEHIMKVRITGTKNAASDNFYHSADRVVVSTMPVYEAEEAATTDGAGIAIEQTGYSGIGYLGDFGSEDASAEFTVNAGTAGDKTLTLKYANGNETDASLSLYVNGEKVKQLTLQSTNAWNAWDVVTETVALNAGENEIAFKVDAEDKGNVLLDAIYVPYEEPAVPPPTVIEPTDPVTPPPAPNTQLPAAGTKYEAEEALLDGGASFNTDHTGYSGEGFVDHFGDEGASATFTVHAASAGASDVTLRYANGGAISSLTIYVNGKKFRQTLVPGFADWDSWGFITDSLELNEGVNTITYKYDSGDIAHVNLDYVSVALPATIYEAENAEFAGNIATDTNHTGYSGTGFAANYWGPGDAVTFTVDALAAGDHDVTFRYANSMGMAQTLTVYVNGTKVRQSSLPSLATWDTWGNMLETLNLNAGTNTIALKFDEGDTGIVNLDYLSVPVPAPKIYEAESAAHKGNIANDTNHTGFSGTGFAANYWGPGDAVAFTVEAASAGNKDVTFRYANSMGSDRTLTIYVNDTKVRQTTFLNLANWDTWGSKVEKLLLNAGTNTITLQFDEGDTGIVNLDYISLPAMTESVPTPPKPPAPPITSTPIPPAAGDGQGTIGTDGRGGTVWTFTTNEANLVAELSGSGSSLSIDVTPTQAVDKVDVSLTAEVIALANEFGKPIIIESNGIQLKLNPGTLNVKADAGTVHLSWSIKTEEQLPQGLESESAIYDLDLFVGNTEVYNFNSPLDVSFKVDPAKIKDPSKVGVYYFNESSGDWEYVGGTMNADGTVTAQLAHFSKYAVMESSLTFADIQGHWAQAAIEALAAKQIVIGVAGGQFMPNGSVTRAEFVSMIARAINLPSVSGASAFVDVAKNAWYGKAIDAAVEARIVNGVGEGKFTPNAKITREQMIVILLRAYAYASGHSLPEIAEVSDFSDQAAISAWAADAIRIAVNLGLANGLGDRLFGPQEESTRAQAATVLIRLLNSLSK